MKELETQRLILRRLRKTDAPLIFYTWANDPEVTKFLTWEHHTHISQTNFILAIWLAEYENDNCYRWLIERKSDGRAIGMIDVVNYHAEMDGAPEIGYCSGREFWGSGYMTEACKAVVQELFDSGFETILISAANENVGSNRVIQKCGFKLYKTKRKAISECKPERIVTVNCYRMDKA